MPILEAMRTVNAEDISIVKPLEHVKCREDRHGDHSGGECVRRVRGRLCSTCLRVGRIAAFECVCARVHLCAQV